MVPPLRRQRSTVSVVVAVTDANAAFLEDCLSALAGQDRQPDEVLLVVSGVGADTRATVAAAQERRADRDWTPALATGAAAVSGTYLLRLEAGDVITPGALGRLAGSLDRSGSDLALPGAPALPGTTLAATPQVLAGAELSSMMLRSAFWREAGVDGSEDALAPWLQPVRALAAASAFDLVGAPVRRRPRRGTGVAFSAFPGFAPHLHRLVPLVEDTLAALTAAGLRTARDALAGWLVAGEVGEYLKDVERCDTASWERLSGLARRLLEELPDAEVAAVPVEQRIRAWLAAQSLRAALEAFNAARWHEEGQYPTRIDDGRVLAVLPVEDASPPQELLEPAPDECGLVTQLRRARWVGDDRLELELVAYGQRMGTDAGPASLGVALVSASGRRLDLAASGLDGTEVNLLAGERHADHSDGLWQVRVDAGQLGGPAPEEWAVHVVWERAGVRRAGVVDDVERRGSAAALPPRHGVRLDVARARLVSGEPDLAPAASSAEIARLALDGDELEVSGVAPDGPLVLRLRGPQGTTSVRAVATDGRFEARLPLRHDPWGLGETALPPGGYRLRLQGEGALGLAEEAAGRTPYVERSPAFRMRVERNPDGSAQLQLGPPLADDELGPRAQHLLRRWYVDVDARLDPGLVYLQSYAGLTATDSPLAIHHELRRSRPGLRLVWGMVDSSAGVPEGGERVLLRSRDWYATLARCGHVVTNVDMDEWFTKRPGQRLLQTFHGYPAKAMGVVAWEGKNFPPSLVERHLRRTSATWDLLLTPHPSMDVHYREQYRYDGPILSAGYPRDDELVGPDAPRLREETRRRLGIGDRTAVLYAPTWRDDLTTNFRAAVMPSTFDVEAAAHALGDDYVILLRGHRFHRQRPEVRGRLLDVTAYPEVNHLVLAADAAVLDYSSLRFDMALTRRPMIFLVPDLDRYEGDVRGFLYDFRTSAPGPLVETTSEVVEALRDLEGVTRRHQGEYDAFAERFNALQDGHAAERVVRTFFPEV